MLIRLVYMSTLAADVTSADIDRIVETSSRENERHGITGMLALESERVCQVLEGEEAAVDALYARIGRDGRHTDIVLLDRRTIDAPHFGDWGMKRRRMVDVVMLVFTRL